MRGRDRLMLRTIRRLAFLAFVAHFTSVARSDCVLDWTEAAVFCIRQQNTAPTMASRNLAMLHLAIYESSKEKPPVDPEAAALAAGRETLSALYPAVRGHINLVFSNAASKRIEIDTKSLNRGKTIAQKWLEVRRNDGSATDRPYIPSTERGNWRRTPPFLRPPADSHWGAVKPFILPTVSEFLPPGPPPVDSERFRKATENILRLGGRESAERTEEQSLVARFWSDFSYSCTPPGHWQEIAVAIARQRTNTFSQNARLFALLSSAQADAAIVCWSAKYRYNFWRPVTAINHDKSTADAARIWEPLLHTPPFPEYPSGHSAFSGASARILARFYGTPELLFTARSDTLPEATRRFTSVEECADEIGLSRIYGGIHFDFSNEDGKACGAKIADFVFDNLK